MGFYQTSLSTVIFKTCKYSQCFFLCLSVCLPACLSVYVRVCLFVCWSLCLTVYRSVSLYSCLSVCSSVCLTDMYSCLSVCSSLCLSPCLSVCPSVCLIVCFRSRLSMIDDTKFAPLFHLTRDKTKTNRDSFALVLAHFVSASGNYFEF